MRVSLKWLNEIFPVDAEVEEIATRLTAGGVEVEGVERKGRGLSGVVIGGVRAKGPHPERDKLTLVEVFDGEQTYEVVCGATNVPERGGRILFARPGSTLPNRMTIEARKLGGVMSHGMICSEAELDIGPDAEGIFVVEPERKAAPGTPVIEALSLDDVILELGVTANRPDCLGHVGVAREMALLSGMSFEWPAVEAPITMFEAASISHKGTPISVHIAEGDRCPRYGAALVTAVNVGPSPFWLRYRLHTLGLRALSNVVDATNLVLLEHGHPIHAFDLQRVRGSRIEVRLARQGEKMTTLDDVERVLSADDLLICDGQGPVAIAGVMGGANSEIRPETSEVLIECAHFDPRSIRRTVRRLGLGTDSSHRFERGVDPNGVPRVLQRAASLIASLGGGVAAPTAIDCVAEPFTPRSVTLRHSRASRLLGVDVDQQAAVQVLARLGCEVGTKVEDRVDVRVPSWRPDLRREVDLIEEVARVQGYDRIPTSVPRVRPSTTGTPPALRFVHDVRRAAAGAGLSEALSYSFVAAEDLKKARVSTDAVALANPLSEERSVMRTSLLVGLVQAAGNAQRREARSVALFEVGHTFHPSGEPLPREDRRVGLILMGERRGWIGDDGPFDFYDGKGVVEAIVRQLVGAVPTFALSDVLDASAPYLHPKRRASVAVGDRVVGHVGELHLDVLDAFSLAGRAVYAELSVPDLYDAAVITGTPQASALPRFPAVTRDIAMLVEQTHTAGEVASALKEAAGGLAESVTIFDLYKGDQVPDGHRSLAFRVVYRDRNETLTDKRVDKVHAKLGQVAKSRFTAQIR